MKRAQPSWGYARMLRPAGFGWLLWLASSPLSATRVDGYVLIVHEPEGRRELYDLARDPAEQHDISEDHVALTELMASLIAAQRDEAALRGHRATRAFTPSPALVEQLEALGYAEDGVNAGAR